MAVSILETIKSKANAGNTAYIVVLSLLCDTYSDLPTQYGLTGYELAQGCKAHVIDTNTDYMLDSAGTWHIYGGGIWQNVYTKTETDALLDDKQDELTTAQLAAVNSGITAKLTADEAALAEVVDNGAKNLLNLGEPEQLPSGVTVVNNDDGTYSISANITANTSVAFAINLKEGGVFRLSGCPTGGGTSSYLLRINNVSGSAISGTSDTGNGSDEFQLTAGNYQVAVRFAAGTYSNLTFKPMLCTAADYAVSQKFVPYRPSWQEMYEMIQALQ